MADDVFTSSYEVYTVFVIAICFIFGSKFFETNKEVQHEQAQKGVQSSAQSSLQVFEACSF
jgi:hypothetical protein